MKSNYSNGLISFSKLNVTAYHFLELTVEQHLKGKDLEQPLSFLVGFR